MVTTINVAGDLYLQLPEAVVDEVVTQLKGFIMPTIDDVNTKLGELKTKLDAVKPAIDGLQQKIADALAGETISPATQAAIDTAFASVSDMVGEAQTALDDAATPPAP